METTTSSQLTEYTRQIPQLIGHHGYEAAIDGRMGYGRVHARSLATIVIAGLRCFVPAQLVTADVWNAV
jgi:hypothetical protein